MHEKDKKPSPFSDYSTPLELQLKNHVPDFGSNYLHDRAAGKFTEVIASIEQDKPAESISKARYYSVLNDGGTDSSVIEQELIYILFFG